MTTLAKDGAQLSLMPDHFLPSCRYPFLRKGKNLFKSYKKQKLNWSISANLSIFFIHE